MNKFTLLFGVLLCLIAVNARHFGDQTDETVQNEEDTLRKPREHNPQARHRKRRWQMNYGYDYPSPSYHYPERRDYDRNSQDVLQHISKLLDEISAYIRRPPPPPPPPQPIYIPYPMYINYPQIPSTPCYHQNATGENYPTFPNRINIKNMDPNRIWGLDVSNDNDYDDGSDGSRPISFDPIVPKQLMKRPTPKVDHGSVQASIQAQATTSAPRFQDEAPSLLASVPVPGMCNAAILSCCGATNNKAQQSQCFGNIGCSGSFADGNACSSESIQKALESFRVAYSPLN